MDHAEKFHFCHALQTVKTSDRTGDTIADTSIATWNYVNMCCQCWPTSTVRRKPQNSAYVLFSSQRCFWALFGL
jgi:hypothetical protein